MMLPTLNIFFRPQSFLNLVTELELLQRLTPALKRYSPLLADWYLKADTVEEALQYKLFDQGLNPLAVTKLEAQQTSFTNDRVLGFWNGLGQDNGASVQCLYGEGMICSVMFQLPPVDTLDNLSQAVDLVEAAVDIWQPSAVSFSTDNYSDQQVFADRLPMGWVLYLAENIDSALIPEASVVKPIEGTNGNSGTLLISTGDKFDDTNPVHLSVAKSIEVRLVDQDLLPRFADL